MPQPTSSSQPRHPLTPSFRAGRYLDDVYTTLDRQLVDGTLSADEAVEWAFRHTLKHFAFRSPKGLTTCLDCGHQWYERDGKRCRCPKCRAELELHDTLCRKAMDRQYCSVLEVQDEMQVQRVFLFIPVR